MASELSFLLDLFLNHKLPVATKKAIMERVRDVEARLSQPLQPVPYYMPKPLPPPPQNIPPHLVGQSPSTIAAMMRNGMANEPMPSTISIAVQEPSIPAVQPPIEPAPVTVVAKTPAAMAAINDRAAAINQGISGKPEKGRTSPRKF